MNTRRSLWSTDLRKLIDRFREILSQVPLKTETSEAGDLRPLIVDKSGRFLIAAGRCCLDAFEAGDFQRSPELLEFATDLLNGWNFPESPRDLNDCELRQFFLHLERTLLKETIDPLKGDLFPRPTAHDAGLYYARKAERLLEILSAAAGNREIESPTLETTAKTKRKKQDRKPTKAERIRRQRNRFSEPRRNKGQTWSEIYDAYRLKHPDDEKASADTLRHALERNPDGTDSSDN